MFAYCRSYSVKLITIKNDFITQLKWFRNLTNWTKSLLTSSNTLAKNIVWVAPCDPSTCKCPRAGAWRFWFIQWRVSFCCLRTGPLLLVLFEQSRPQAFFRCLQGKICVKWMQSLNDEVNDQLVKYCLHWLIWREPGFARRLPFPWRPFQLGWLWIIEINSKLVSVVLFKCTLEGGSIEAHSSVSLQHTFGRKITSKFKHGCLRCKYLTCIMFFLNSEAV